MDGDGAKKKRGTESQLTKETVALEETKSDVEPGDFARASEEQLKNRQIRRVRRPPVPQQDESQHKNPFAGISLTSQSKKEDKSSEEATKDEATAKKNESESAEEKEEEARPEAAIEEAAAIEDKNKPSEDETAPSKGESKEDASAGKSVFSTPAAAKKEIGKERACGSNGSQSQVTDFGSARSRFTSPSTSLNDTSFKPIEGLKNGEEEEETVFSETAVLYLNQEGAWKAGGRGTAKINVDKEGVARVLMRQEVTLKLLLNARLYKEMKPMKMNTSAVSFTCQNVVGSRTDKDEYDIVALKFKSEAKQKVDALIDAIESYKGGNKANS